MNLVHIGLPKTGSTTLQGALFPCQPRFTYVGKVGRVYAEPVKELVNRISFQDSLDYDPARADALVAEFRKPGKPLLVSDEIFSGEGRVDRRLIAERLHRLFAPAKVLIVLRAQPTMLQSLYLNDLRAAGRGVISFEAWLEQTYGGVRFPDSHRVGLDYMRLISVYEDLFGRENVVVRPYEWMKDPESGFSATLGELLGMPQSQVQQILTGNVDNQRMSRRHMLTLRIQERLPKDTNLAMLGRRMLPGWLYRPIRDFVSGGKRLPSPDIPPGWMARISRQCARGNAEIAARTHLPLQTLGYPVEP